MPPMSTPTMLIFPPRHARHPGPASGRPEHKPCAGHPLFKLTQGLRHVVSRWTSCFATRQNHRDCGPADRLSPGMARSKTALAILILGGLAFWTSAAHAQVPAPPHRRPRHSLRRPRRPNRRRQRCRKPRTIRSAASRHCRAAPPSRATMQRRPSRSATRSSRATCCRPAAMARWASRSTTRPRSPCGQTQASRWTTSSIRTAAPATRRCSTSRAARSRSSPARWPRPAT